MAVHRFIFEVHGRWGAITPALNMCVIQVDTQKLQLPTADNIALNVITHACICMDCKRHQLILRERTP